jgi:lysophospholipase L1-like esterase
MRWAAFALVTALAIGWAWPDVPAVPTHQSSHQRPTNSRCRGGCSGVDNGSVSAFTVTGAPNVAVTTATSPITGAAKRWCVVINLAAQAADWAQNTTRGMVQMGSTTFGANNTLSLYSLGSVNSCFWIAKHWDATGTFHEVDSKPATTSNVTGACINPTHQVSFCQDGASGYWFIDGVQTNTGAVSSNINWGSTIRLANLGTATSPYGNGITQVCVGTPNGTTSGMPATDINNTCGQFTDTRPTIGEQYACFGCLGSLPIGGARKVYALGDSITFYGVGVPRPYPAKLNAILGTGYDVTNAGLSGDIVSNMKTRYEATARNWDRCIFSGGINDFQLNNATAAATFATASALLDEMRADGCRPIVLLVTPWANWSTWTAGKQTNSDSYNSSLLSYCSTNSATTTCIDLRGTTGNGLGDGATPVGLAAAFDSSDHLHPNQAGLDRIATAVSAVTWP